MRQSGELSCSPAAGSCSQPFLHKSTIFIHKYQTFQSWRSYPCQGVPVRADFQRHDGSDLRSGVVCPSLDGPSCVRVTCRTISHHQTFPLATIHNYNNVDYSTVLYFWTYGGTGTIPPMCQVLYLTFLQISANESSHYPMDDDSYSCRVLEPLLVEITYQKWILNSLCYLGVSRGF